MGFQRRSFVASPHYNGSLRVESSAFYCLPSRPFPDEPDRMIEFSDGPIHNNNNCRGFGHNAK